MKILFLGGDKRYLSVIDALKGEYDITVCGYDSVEIDVKKEKINNIDINNYNLIVLPFSGINNDGLIQSLDGELRLVELEKIDKNTTLITGLSTEKIKQIGCNVVSFLEFDDIKKLNNKITVDGIENDIKEKNKSTITILGYGNIGKELYNRLSEKNVNCIVGEIDEKKVKDLENSFNTLNINEFKRVVKVSNIIINTVPKNIITDEIVDEIKDDTYILDVASYPYGIDQSKIKKLNYHLYSGIPGKYNPEESGKVLLKKIKGIIGG